MKGSTFSTLLVSAVMVLLLVNIILMTYVMYTISNSMKYEIKTDNKIQTVTKEGVEATKFWSDNKMFFIAPTVGNVLGIVLLGLLYVMG